MEENLDFAKYAVSLKQALKCWTDAKCDEHEIPCQLALKEFAIAFFEMQNKIEVLQKAIRTHKQKNVSPNDDDLELYKLI